MDNTSSQSQGAKANLGVWDAASIVVGIIIGVGIFEAPQEVFKQAPGPIEVMLVWTLGGMLAIIGALCFAELASAYPHSGGEYVYLTRAYGSIPGFLYGWAQLAVIRPASIAAMAYIFAVHAKDLMPGNPLVLAVSAVILLTVINILGATLGANTQNLLTAAKIVGLAGIIVFGLFFSPLQIPEAVHVPAEPGWFPQAMILVLWTYAGWNEAAYIASEVKNPRRNLPLALILGTLAVTVIYLLVNGAILLALGFEGARRQSPGSVLRSGLGNNVINAMIMVSALGAINGMIFTTARIYSACGKDHRLFKSLSHWSRRGTPVRALVLQGILNVGYLLGGAWISSGLGSDPVVTTAPDGAEQVEAQLAGLKSLSYWADLTASVFWFFFLLAGLSLLILRCIDAETPRPFRAPLYPILPLVFCGWCAYMVVASIWRLPRESFFGFLVILAGLPLYYLPKKKRRPRIADEGEPLMAATRQDKG